MSSGAKQIIQYAKEVTPGVTPSPFARISIPFVSDSLNATPTRSESALIKDGRLASAGALTMVEYAGDITTELKYSIFDDLFAGAAFNNWNGNVLTFGGNVRQAFSIVKGYTDIGNYQTFGGMIPNTLAIDVPAQDVISLTFGFMGRSRTPSDTAPAGVVTPAENNPSISNIGVGDILIDGVSQTGTACISAFNFNWDNGIQRQDCLGSGLSVGNLIETLANGTGSFTVAWSTGAAANYEKQFTDATISLSIPLTDSIGNKYTLFIPKVQITAPLATGARGDIISTTFDYTVVDEAPTLTREDYVELEGIEISPPTVTLELDETQQLSVTFDPTGATNKDVTYVSSNTEVATVSSTGLITAVAVGTATITATSEDGGHTDTCVVTVVV